MAECIPSIPVASAKAELEQDWKAPRSELPIVGHNAQASICVSSNPFGENNNPSQYSCSSADGALFGSGHLKARADTR